MAFIRFVAEIRIDLNIYRKYQLHKMNDRLETTVEEMSATM